MDQGITYRNYRSKETSDLLLSLLKLILVLSGHDHDQCTVVPTTPFGPVTEHTLETISWQQGNLYPSFMLLSTGPKLSTNSTDLKHEVYLSFCSDHPAADLLANKWSQLSSLCERIMRSVGAELFSITKEKDDEKDGEYEMVRDACTQLKKPCQGAP